MRLMKQGHACVMVEVGDVNILIDPGKYADLTFEGELAAICITHSHADHFDSDLVTALATEHGAPVYAQETVAKALGEVGFEAASVSPGDEFSVDEVGIEVLGGKHAVIHKDLPSSRNVGFLVDSAFLHPGDSLDIYDHRISALAIPTVGPWMATADAVDYLRRVAPRLALPIHDGIASQPAMFAKYVADLAPNGTIVATHESGSWVAVP